MKKRPTNILKVRFALMDAAPLLDFYAVLLVNTPDGMCCPNAGLVCCNSPTGLDICLPEEDKTYGTATEKPKCKFLYLIKS